METLLPYNETITNDILYFDNPGFMQPAKFIDL